MPHHPHLMTYAGYLAIGLGVVIDATAWTVAQLTPNVPPSVGAAGAGAAWAGVLGGLATLWINNHFAQKNDRRETERRFAELERKAEEAESLAARKVEDAKAEHARQVANILAEAERKVADIQAETERKIEVAKLESQRRHAKIADDAIAAASRRKAEREFQNKELLRLSSELREARAEVESISARIEPAARGIDRNSAAIVTVAEAVGVPVEPAPRMDGGAGEMDPRPPAPAPHPASRPTVVIVEDDPASLQLLSREFRAAGWNPVAVPDGIAASEYVHSGAVAADCFLVDLELPGVPGPDVIRLIRECGVRGRDSRSPVRVVGYTGADESRARSGAIEAGADDVLFKPASWDDTLAAVRGEGPPPTPGPGAAGRSSIIAPNSNPQGK